MIHNDGSLSALILVGFVLGLALNSVCASSVVCLMHALLADPRPALLCAGWLSKTDGWSCSRSFASFTAPCLYGRVVLSISDCSLAGDKCSERSPVKWFSGLALLRLTLEDRLVRSRRDCVLVAHLPRLQATFRLSDHGRGLFWLALKDLQSSCWLKLSQWRTDCDWSAVAAALVYDVSARLTYVPVAHGLNFLVPLRWSTLKHRWAFSSGSLTAGTSGFCCRVSVSEADTMADDFFGWLSKTDGPCPTATHENN